MLAPSGTSSGGRQSFADLAVAACCFARVLRSGGKFPVKFKATHVNPLFVACPDMCPDLRVMVTTISSATTFPRMRLLLRYSLICQGRGSSTLGVLRQRTLCCAIKNSDDGVPRRNGSR